MRVYELIVKTDSLNTSYLFSEQPTRKEIMSLFLKIWRKLTPSAQDESWDIVLLAYLAPIVPWLGEHETYIGTLQCKVHGVIT